MQETLKTTHCANCDFSSILFKNLSLSEYDKLNKAKKEYVFKKGQKIISEGHQITEFIYLQKGLVKMSKQSENKKDHIISIALPRSFIGFLTVFSQDRYGYSITALEETTLCFIEIELIREIILNNGGFALNVLSKISEVSDEIIYKRVNIYSKQIRGRIAYLLIVFSKEIFFKTRFELPVTRREIGELIGMSTANVIRILSEFQRDNIVKINKSAIEITNFSMLEKVSKYG